VISASVQAEDTQTVFKLLAAGAVDIFPKPRAGLLSEYEQAKQELISKIKILSGVAVFTQHRKVDRSQELEINSLLKTQNLKDVPLERLYSKFNNQNSILPKAIAIGSSTGGPQALQTILTQLPADLPVPVICIQHISEGFLQGLVNWLGAECHLPIQIARNGESLRPGNIYFAPEKRHLEVDAQGRCLYSNSPAVGGHCPSITVTFRSVAKYYGSSAIGILLTGMGRDGADGMQAIAQAGGMTIAQDEASCVVFGMPKEAIALGAANYILPVKEIAPLLLRSITVKSNR
jgi:two-component system chemotaxis response regulator CheB